MHDYDDNLIKVEVLNNLFMFDKRKIKILLLKNESDPYKGYWFLPRGILLQENTIEETATETMNEYIGLDSISFAINHTFSATNRIPDQRVLAVSTIGFIDEVTLSLKQEKTKYAYSWFPIENLPKMVYDHSEIAGKAIQDLKNILSLFSNMKQLFPSDFTLPELQKAYEEICQETLDRRNFRKKIMTLDVIEETGENNIGESGRPAKLYRFKEKIENKSFFSTNY